MNEKLVWVDCEMTGLDLTNDALVEVAALVTDADLNVLGAGIDVVIRPPEEALNQMSAFVRTMHQHSGLLAALDGIGAGSFPPRPHDEMICRYCAYPSVCRKDYVGDV